MKSDNCPKRLILQGLPLTQDDAPRSIPMRLRAHRNAVCNTSKVEPAAAAKPPVEDLIETTRRSPFL
jgi:hypothetical protein